MTLKEEGNTISSTLHPLSLDIINGCIKVLPGDQGQPGWMHIPSKIERLFADYRKTLEFVLHSKILTEEYFSTCYIPYETENKCTVHSISRKVSYLTLCHVWVLSSSAL